MLEIGLILAIMAGATLVVGRLLRRQPADHILESVVDLPCPWCRAQTREDDRECPSCHQEFGIVTR